jgi:hypothetical protein
MLNTCSAVLASWFARLELNGRFSDAPGGIMNLPKKAFYFIINCFIASARAIRKPQPLETSFRLHDSS